MTTASPLLLALDLTGTFAFGLNGALTAVKATRLDIVGVLTLGVITAMGGGIIPYRCPPSAGRAGLPVRRWRELVPPTRTGGARRFPSRWLHIPGVRW